MSADPNPTPSWREVLQVHSAAELLPLMPPEELHELGEDITAHGLRVPVTVLKSKDQLWLLDGRNRLDAMVTVGLPVVADGKLTVNHKTLDEGADFDPAAYVVSANIKRRHLTAEQKRDLIGKLLKGKPERSDRETAKIAGVSHPTVAAVRQKQERAGHVVNLTTRTDTRGRRQPAKKAGAPHPKGQLSSGEMAEIRRTTPATMTQVASLLLLDPDRTLAGIERLLKDAKSSLKVLPKEKRVAFYRGFMGTLRRSLDLLDADLGPIG